MLVSFVVVCVFVVDLMPVCPFAVFIFITVVHRFVRVFMTVYMFVRDFAQTCPFASVLAMVVHTFVSVFFSKWFTLL